MNASHILNAYKVKDEVRKVEVNPKRVAEWALIFTNIFFVSYFFIKLFGIF